MIKTVFFRVDGDAGKYAGLGHIYRTLSVYNFLKKELGPKYKYVFLCKNYKEGINIIRKNTKEKIILFSKSKLKKISFKKSDVVIIDMFGAENFFLKKLSKMGIKKICFDQIELKYFKSGLIINGIIFTKKFLKKTKKVKIYQGLKYIVLNKQFAIKRLKKRYKKIITILLCSGGADYKEFLYKISKIIIRLKNYKLKIAIGKAVKRNNKVFNLKSNMIKLLKTKNNLKKTIENSDILICSGGTVMFEGVAVGKKPIAISNYEHQKYAINYFAKRKLVFNAGDASKINSNTLTKALKNILKLNIKKTFIRNANTIDGKGLDRVNKIIKQYIK